MITLNDENIEFKCFKYDNSKLLQLTENMILNKEVKTSLDFAKKFMFTFDSQEPFPINIDSLIEMKVFDEKGNCKKKLIKHFILDTDYKLISLTCEKTQVKEINQIRGGFRHKENIMLSVDCFKSMCMFSNSEQGKTVKLYYLDLERIFKRFINIELETKGIELETKEKENKILLTKYNNSLQKHRFHKFKKTGACFYVIVQGLEYKDNITRIKIGVSGCIKRNTKKCPNCEQELEDIQMTMSLDSRLANHRTLWPQLQVKFVVYTNDAELLEKNMKRLYEKQINPHGHEIIENVSVEEVTEQVIGFLKIINRYNVNNEIRYTIEDSLEDYNKNTVTQMKNHVKEITFVIEKEEQKIEFIEKEIIKNEVKIVDIEKEIKVKKSDVNKLRINVDEHKKYLVKKIEEFKDLELRDMLTSFNLLKTGNKQIKYDRCMKYIKEQIHDDRKEAEPDRENKIKYQNKLEMDFSGILPSRLIRLDYTIKNNNAPKDERYCNGFCQSYQSIKSFNYRSESLMTICLICESMLDIAKNRIESGVTTAEIICKDPSILKIGENDMMCRKCNIVKSKTEFCPKKRQCKKCRNKVRSKYGEIFDEKVETEIEELTKLPTDKMIKKMDTYVKSELHKLVSFLKIGRKYNDNKQDLVKKLINHFK